MQGDTGDSSVFFRLRKPYEGHDNRVTMAARGSMIQRRQQHPLRWAALWTCSIVCTLAGAAILCGWPYWQVHPWAALITSCCCAGLGAAGALMLTESQTRACGVTLIGAGAAWATTWASSWDAGILPMLSQFSQAIFFLAIGAAVLLYINPGKRELPERTWIAAAVLVLLGGTAVSIVASSPAWMGYRPGVPWPHVHISHSHFLWLINVLCILYVLLAAGYDCVLLIEARRKLPRLQMMLTTPVLAATGASALLAAFAEQGSTLTSLSQSLRIFVYEGALTVPVLAALLSTGLINRCTGLMAKNLLMAHANPPTMSGVRDALAQVLDDPALQIYYRFPQSDYYLDCMGRCAGTFNEADWIQRSGVDRWCYRIFTDAGVLVAILDLDLRLRQRPGLLDAAKSVAQLLLLHSDLRGELRAAGLKLQRQAQIGILQTGLTERRRIERDLHDGAQQMLLALSMKMGAVAAATSDSGMQELVAAWQQDLRNVCDELRNLARGIYPATLSERGLRAAFESLAERQADLHVVLDIPDSRFPEIIETNLYFSVAEALTNVSKHAQASKAWIGVRHEPPRLTCSIEDNGNGRVCVRAGGGLEGIIVNRIRVLGGDVRIAAAPGEGSMIEMTLPCE